MNATEMILRLTILGAINHFIAPQLYTSNMNVVHERLNDFLYPSDNNKQLE